MARTREPARAQRAFAGGDTRLLKRELEAGNRFAWALLRRRGLDYEGGAIFRAADRDAALDALARARTQREER